VAQALACDGTPENQHEHGSPEMVHEYLQFWILKVDLRTAFRSWSVFLISLSQTTSLPAPLMCHSNPTALLHGNSPSFTSETQTKSPSSLILHSFRTIPFFQVMTALHFQPSRKEKVFSIRSLKLRRRYRTQRVPCTPHEEPADCLRALSSWSS
jgi:hypothetical protein